MVCRGYDVLAIDQIGAGQSDKPDGDFLNMNVTIDALHQVLAQVRDGMRFKKLWLVGHSFGAEQAVLLHAFDAPAHALVVSGWGHTFSPPPRHISRLPNAFSAPSVPIVLLQPARV